MAPPHRLRISSPPSVSAAAQDEAAQDEMENVNMCYLAKRESPGWLAWGAYFFFDCRHFNIFPRYRQKARLVVPSRGGEGDEGGFWGILAGLTA
ncbi:MAG: hypothetical protein LBR11_05105 [Deltaproteobacteria bacterium]|nr:hypothetical protein [Deltaproteobacteria bacterium]